MSARQSQRAGQARAAYALRVSWNCLTSSLVGTGWLPTSTRWTASAGAGPDTPQWISRPAGRVHLPGKQVHARLAPVWWGSQDTRRSRVVARRATANPSRVYMASAGLLRATQDCTAN